MSSILKVDEIQNTGGTSALTIQSSGAVKKPNLPYLYADLYNGSSAGYDAHANQTPVQFRRVISSSGGITLNTSTYTFTVPLIGIYQINYQLLIQTAANLDFSIAPSQGNEVFRSYRYNERGIAASLAIPLNEVNPKTTRAERIIFFNLIIICYVKNMSFVYSLI